jgi:hypothetical protein
LRSAWLLCGESSVAKAPKAFAKGPDSRDLGKAWLPCPAADFRNKLITHVSARAVMRSNSLRTRVSTFAVPETPIRNDAVIRVYDAGNVLETHEHKGEFKEP